MAGNLAALTDPDDGGPGRSPSAGACPPVESAGRPSPQDATPAVDLYVATIDGLGRLPLRKAATTMAWGPRSTLRLSVQDGVLRLSENPMVYRHTRDHPPGIGVELDGRCRVLLPYGIRVATGFEPGLRLVVVMARPERVVAALPLHLIITALVGGP